jgi:hypothetical protein
MLEALKLAVEALIRRNESTGLNAWEYEALKAGRVALKAEAGIIFNGREWVKWQLV